VGSGRTLVYSLFSLVEGIGLISVSWAGWLAIGESAFFIPIEIGNWCAGLRRSALVRAPGNRVDHSGAERRHCLVPVPEPPSAFPASSSLAGL